MPFTLRSHQSQLVDICREILAGKKITQIIASVTPGGGKSAMPVILAQMLIPTIAEKEIWVCPRNPLKYQGEEEFTDPRWQTKIRLRAANGNCTHPDRGSDGYLTTFQAVGVSPEIHLAYVKKHKTILFLDEAQFLGEDGAWAEAMKPIIDAAVLTIFATGTIARGDGNKIAFLDYSGGYVDLSDSSYRRVITYGRKKAIEERSILPVYGRTIDGAAEWISKEGIHRRVDSIYNAWEDRSDAVFTALRTDYAFQLLNACIKDWEEMREVYPEAKLLVVAPNIEYANNYKQYIARRYLFDIATSEDSPKAHRAIDAYKRGSFPILVTVAMAFVGLSVKSITHIACLTQIRSVPWLEQCFARANRCAEGKPCGVIYGPADRKFLTAMRMIENEERPALKDEEDENPAGNSFCPDLVDSVDAPQVQPLWSSVIGVQTDPIAENTAPEITPSETERIVKENIRAIRQSVINGKKHGGIKSAENLLNLRIRSVCDKSLKDMTADEIVKVWMYLKEKYAKN